MMSQNSSDAEPEQNEHSDQDKLSVSKSQRKRDALEITALGDRISQLSASERARMPLSDTVRDAVEKLAATRSFSARKRQMQYLGKLLRNEDLDDIHSFMADQRLEQQKAIQQHHSAEEWRERLLAGGRETVAEFVNDHPGADTQRLNQLLRNARKEKQQNRQPRHQRELFRLLRELLGPVNRP